MKLGHLYNALIVKGTDYPRYGSDGSSILYIASNEYRPGDLEKRLGYILELDDPDTLKKFTENNYLAMNAILSMLRAARNYLSHNHKIVANEYSNESVARKLDTVIRKVMGKK